MKQRLMIIRATSLFIMFAGVHTSCLASAEFISQLIPQSMNTGESTNIILQFRNTGSTAWAPASKLELRLKNGSGNWLPSRISLDDNKTVRRGQLATFKASIRAPDQAGSYKLQWQLYDSQQGWLGKPSPVAKIIVSKGLENLDSEFINQHVEGLQKAGQYFTILKRGTVYPVTISFKNTGSHSWQHARINLRSRNESAELLWSVDEVELINANIAHGEIYTFSFNIITPIQPGIYNFQWQLANEKAKTFGDSSENIVITVR